MLKQHTNQNLLFPATIIIIGIIISGGILMYRTVLKNDSEEFNKNIPQEVGIKPITSEDKILGNPNADIIIVEYSDFECPYCKLFHSTMNDIMHEYGRNGKVAWIFRHFPLDSHKNAKGAAIAAECVYRIGGNEKFWEYSNILFASSTDILSKDNLESIAVNNLSLEQEKYNACLNNADVLAKIESDVADGKIIYENDPNFGTPYSFVITKTGIQTKIIGAQPFSDVKALIDQFI